MRGVTPIDLVDIDSIPNEIPNSNQNQYPGRTTNPNFNDQIEMENAGRMPQLSRKDIDWKKALGGGSYTETIYQNEFDLQPKNGRSSSSFGNRMYDPNMQVQVQTISCIDIANHVSNCPICTRFYSPEDKTHLYFIIVVLCLVCFVLFKRVIELK